LGVGGDRERPRRGRHDKRGCEKWRDLASLRGLRTGQRGGVGHRVPQQVGRSMSEGETTKNEGSFEERGKEVSRDRSGERKRKKRKREGSSDQNEGGRESSAIMTKRQKGWGKEKSVVMNERERGMR
jgi:hypothetical protein